MHELYDVAIVGYGPVGQALAIFLGQRGWRVGVFEKQPKPYPLPRAVHFDHEVGRILQAAGLGDDLRGKTEVADVYEWRNAAGDTLLRFDTRDAGTSGWPATNMFSQPDLEGLLDRRARSLDSIEVHRGHEVNALDADASEVTIEMLESGERRTPIRARYVVGCDGANSFVRSHLGSTVSDLGFFYDWLIVDVIPHEPTVWQPLNLQICDPARPASVISGGPGRRRWEFMCLPHDSIEDLNREEAAWRLLAPWNLRPDNATLERHAVYRFQARWVDVWRKGRILLAGDAAHQMPPFAGQGMCSGLRDAINLAWKLDLVLAGSAPGSLLDTYPAERIPHVSDTIRFSMELGKVICVPDPAEAANRDAAMIAALQGGVATARPPAVGIGPGARLDEAPAGELFVQGRVKRDGAIGLFDDVVGRGWTLLSPAGDPAVHLDPEAKALFESLGGFSAHVGANAPVRDLDGIYTEWFERKGAALVLQRPDFYVFGAAPGLEQASSLLGELRRKLGLAEAAGS